MRNFLKPTKVTWITLIVLLVGNALFFVLGLVTFNWTLILIPLVQIGWLYDLFETLGIGVFDNSKSSEFIASPNFLGWALIIIGTLISLAAYYLIASYVSKRHYQNKKAAQNTILIRSVHD